MTAHIESGIQLLARLTSNCRKPLEGLDTRLFPEGLQAKQTVEIFGDPGSGKTLLLTQLIATCILPSEYNKIAINGFDMNILLINTDHHFQVSKLSQIMHNILKKSFINQLDLEDPEVVKEIIEKSLKNLLVVNCFDNKQFMCTLYTLSDVLNSNSKIGIVAIDGIPAFYWQDREAGKKDLVSMNYYVSDTLNQIQKSTFQFNVKIIYTRHAEFVTKGQNISECVLQPTLGEVNHRLNLFKEMDSTRGVCKVESILGPRSFDYETTALGLKWIEAHDN
ncbi:DNA repair protein XRCC2 [Belonocnema kinseyi]|uniref:DNA repair protein XRCC2 n=1 Tax=Belonocnema kinseyi TaxID=2817044 RepID=UPI00143D0224|nr:DNA repair protein XRCC2 [Belonocnema kinseyi]